MVGCALEMGLIDEPLPVVADRFIYSQAFDDRWHRTPDIAHARQRLGFAPTREPCARASGGRSPTITDCKQAGMAASVGRSACT